ncbi:MAG: hypothetical protein IKN12_06970 [Selenomonadaceae bacterium]|nr:hypothetical protein [Selenomonadaceae bacterium]
MDGDYTIIGRRKDGTFVKYIDTRDLSMRYFGNDNKHGDTKGFIVYGDPLYINGDEISVDCYHYNGGNNFPGQKICRFRFRWNEQAQWFSVEQLR